MKKLVLTGHTSQIALELLELLKSKGRGNLQIVKCGRSPNSDRKVDFSSYDQTRAFIAWLRKSRPDYLFLNHGILPGKRLSDASDAIIDESYRVNLVSFAMIIEALPEFNGLSTVVMSSISGKAGSFDTLYAASKAGVDVLVKRTAASLPPSSRLNAVSPGIIADARMTIVRTDAEVLKSALNATPTRQFTKSRDVASLVSFLLFDAENMLGENINLNGGRYIP